MRHNPLARAQVYPATYAGVQVAVKQLDASAGLGKAREEVLAAMSVAHDNVVHIVAVSMDPNFVDRCPRRSARIVLD